MTLPCAACGHPCERGDLCAGCAALPEFKRFTVRHGLHLEDAARFVREHCA